MSAAALSFIPPEILAEYERVFPGLGERLLRWTERQQDHRIELEKMRARGSKKRKDRAQIGSLVVAAGGIVIAGVVGIVGSWIAASVIAIVAVGGPLAAVALASHFNKPQLPPPMIRKPNTQPPGTAA